MIKALTTAEDVRKYLDSFQAGWEHFAKEGGLPGSFNREHFCTSWGNLVSSGVGILIVDEADDGTLNAAIGGACFDDLATGEKLATEMFWYAMPSGRGKGAGLKLLAEFERVCFEEKGRERIFMICLEGLNPEQMSSLFAKTGYKMIERIFVKGKP